MWVLSGEQAINMDKVSQLLLKAAAGEMKLLARLDCGEEVAVASGDPNEMFRLLEALVKNHTCTNVHVGVFDIDRWRTNRKRVGEHLREVAL